METVGQYYYKGRSDMLGLLQAWHTERPLITKINWVTFHLRMDDLLAVLSSPHGHKIRGLEWSPIYPAEDVTEAIPVFAELEWLKLNHFADPSSADIFSMVLERPNKLTKISLNEFSGDAARFFVALQASRVTSFEVGFRICCTPAFFNEFKAFLVQDRLVSFSQTASNHSKRGMGRALEVDEILAGCVNLEELKYDGRAPLVVSKSVKKLWLRFVPPTTRHTLEIPRVRELTLEFSGSLEIVSPNLERLKVELQNLTTYPLKVDLSSLHALDIQSELDRHTIRLIGEAIMGGRLRELRLPYTPMPLSRSHVGLLGPMLKHPNCALVKLDVWGARFDIKATVCKFQVRVGMFALLLARKRSHGKMRTLPVEMYRMVGQMLV